LPQRRLRVDSFKRAEITLVLLRQECEADLTSLKEVEEILRRMVNDPQLLGKNPDILEAVEKGVSLFQKVWGHIGSVPDVLERQNKVLKKIISGERNIRQIMKTGSFCTFMKDGLTKVRKQRKKSGEIEGRK